MTTLLMIHITIGIGSILIHALRTFTTLKIHTSIVALGISATYISGAGLVLQGAVLKSTCISALIYSAVVIVVPLVPRTWVAISHK